MGATGSKLGGLVRGFRKRAGLTQLQVAEQAGLSAAGLRDVEQGRVVRPRVSTLRRLAEVLALSRIELEELIREAGGEGGSGLRVEVLGPLKVAVNGESVDPGSETQRVLLGLLALSPNAPVARDSLIEAVWGERSVAGSADLLQSRVSRLRRRLQADSDETPVLVADRGGYQLSVAEVQHDLMVFRRLVAGARQAREAAEARGLFADAVALWRGEPLEGLGSLQAHPLITSLTREYHAVLVEYAAVAAELGHHREVLPHLQRVADADPLHEAVHAALMIALAGSGQQAAALNVFDSLRRRLAGELGADPGPELSAACQRVLRQEVSRPEFTPVSAHRQLPPDIGEFTGREAELRALHEDLPQAGGSAVKIVLIEGMGGVGKTRLAVHAAHRLLATGRFSDCQLYVDLRGHADQPPADPAAVLASFLRLLGVPDDHIPSRVDERMMLFRDRLYDKKALVLLDNASSEDQVTPLLPSGPENVVLVTSRCTLALDGARTMPLDVFTPEEAEGMLAKAVGRGRVEVDPAAARSLVELCGRLPLAVALAARRLQSRRMWTVSDLAARLEESDDRLHELVAGNRRLRTVFDLSYQALEQDERRLFRLLGLHPGDEFTADAAAALAGITATEARILLDRLVDEHLANVVTRHRYRLHDLLAEYGRGLVREEEPEAERSAAITRVLDFYLHSTACATRLLQPHQPEVSLVGSEPEHRPALSTREDARSWLDSERACLIAAVRLAAARGWPTHAWQLTRSLREYLYLYGYGHDHDWVRTHEAALAAAIAAQDAAGEAMTRADLAATYLELGRGAEAREHLYRALEFHRRTGDRALETSTLESLGVVCFRLGEFDEALQHLRKGASLCAGRDPYREGVLRSNLGNALAAKGFLHEALASLQTGLELSRQAGNIDGESSALADIGDAHRRLGDHEAALEYLHRALELAADHGLTPKVAYANHRLGKAYRELGCYSEATANLQAARQIVAKVGGPAAESEVLVDLGAAHRDVGDFARAGVLLDQGLSLATDRGERYQQALALRELGELHHRTGREDLANAAWRRADEKADATNGGDRVPESPLAST
ncbi:DNA-binding transcriptional activator of the SARP family [Saccharopolyspora shandongensis]|uniref:DNA-binding transcriptional activator of the SARP family n=1 Tax=Saccharopolyspora shandongensis TaxID=418495 RepID=A0A1H3TY15_9PSEU|nr:BTAD domain-containing putative transcriptional regulator [Saccharopolyspora shandongensis]SDZ54978.1 DNA-binding transcriptional activator of the SARP family [Saccharopolyspora shandongensis]